MEEEPLQRCTGGAEWRQNARRGVVVIGRRTAEKVNRYFTMEEMNFCGMVFSRSRDSLSCYAAGGRLQW